ncbi:MAG: NAD(P)(+) transhydrogenase (Re/Si-specific) subunit beta [Saprospiraceae bacterium]|nr:NAD(P)(+) transhydrogenase (Re/Si-specific) subunit beta [Saprospiraceae bacterium]
MSATYLLDLLYLIASLTFVVGLKMLSHPDTARRGNQVAAVGMGLAVMGTLLFHPSADRDLGDVRTFKLLLLYAALAIGGMIGWLAAYRVKMTSMPQMVSLFNGLGGGCAALLAVAELKLQYDGAGHDPISTGAMILVLFTMFFGAVSFTGSMLAYAKLEDMVKDSAITLPRHSVINMILLAGILGLIGYITWGAGENGMMWGLILFGIALVYGFMFVAPIGGADMPVVISVLNSFTGLTAAAAGIIYDNLVMLVGGILVGASGSILTILMCKAMNRSIMNVLVGSFGGGGAAGAGKAAGDQTIKEVSISDAAVLLNYSGSVVIVPGYGLAVAQAQKICKELDELLESNGVEVKYAIHPVAGRMPGHMNVLLAEADVPYPKLFDLEEANDIISKSDVVIVVGANDVVNPAAKDDPSSPIYGMPVLEVWEAKNVIVMKRSMKSGYAGIENELFFHPKTKMLFGDAKDTLQKLVNEVKSL